MKIVWHDGIGVELGLLQVLRTRQADTPVITGAETDVCVLAAVL